MRGDIVVLADDNSGQMGTVTEVYSFADLEHVYSEDKLMYSQVPSNLLFPASAWRFELAVSRDGWIGGVNKFYWRLRVRLGTSKTLLTIDTYKVLGKALLPLARRRSHVLKDKPSEGRFIVGTLVAIARNASVDGVEGDKEWRTAPLPSTTEFAGTLDDCQQYVTGIIVATDLSGLHVDWADYAEGAGAGGFKPRPYQRIDQVSIVDPGLFCSFGRYELSWATPEIQSGYTGDNGYFQFPDGTRLNKALLRPFRAFSEFKDTSSTNNTANQRDPSPTNDSNGRKENDDPKTTSSSAPTPSNDPDSTESRPSEEVSPPTYTPPPPAINTAAPKSASLSYHPLAESCANSEPLKSIEERNVFAIHRKHPDSTSATTLEGYSRKMTDSQFARFKQAFMHLQMLNSDNRGYVEDDLVYVKSMVTFVDVQWQDGTTTKKLVSTDLNPYLQLSDTDFQPNDFVNSVPTTIEESESARLAVIQSVDHQNRVATVWWVREDSIEPHVSIYMLDDASDKYHFRIGYFVARVLMEHEPKMDGTIGLVDNLDDRGRVYVLWVEGSSGWYYPCQLKTIDLGEYEYEPNVYEGPDLTTRELPASQISYVSLAHTLLNNGLANEVTDEREWESESMAGDHDLQTFSRVKLYEDFQRDSANDEDQEEEEENNDEEEEEEQEEEEEESESDCEDQDEEDDNSGLMEHEDESGMLRKDSRAPSRARSTEKATGSWTLEGEDQEESGDDDEEEDHGQSLASGLSEIRFSKSPDTGEENGSSKAGSSSSRDDEEESKLESFVVPKKELVEGDVEAEEDESSAFRIIEEVPANHNFKSYSIPKNKTLPKMAMKEWTLLQSADLSGAYVRGYEDRVDLFRFLIIGAHGTPFYLSWFMFDLHLHMNHPNEPPRVHFHSLGPKLHPNLYEDGTVCLSLLGTWNGDSTESWQPTVSSILQVVLSIQGLILGVKEPYYLEAGYDKHKGTTEGTANSLVYNERSFLLSVQQMKKLIERPPPEFKDIIIQSFLEHRDEILVLENATSSDPALSSKVDLTMFGLPRGTPSLGFISAFKSIFPAIKKVLQGLTPPDTSS